MRPQDQLDFSSTEWHDHQSFQCVSVSVRREGGRKQKELTVIVDHVTNPEHLHFGAWLVSSPWAREGLQHRTFCKTEHEAKHKAENLLDSLIDAVRDGELNWWTGVWTKGAQ